MPKKADWLQNIDEIILTVERVPADAKLVRLDIERAFTVNKTEALRIMDIAGSDLTGRFRTVTRDGLLAYLNSRRNEATVARSRRKKVLETVHTEQQLSRTKGLIFKLKESRPRMESLPPSISFEETGVLKVAYSDGQDLAQSLVDLAKAMMFDFDRFVEITGGRPDSESIPPSSAGMVPERAEPPDAA